MTDFIELCAWEIAHDDIRGIKFVTITGENEKHIFGFYVDKRGPQKPKFDKETGKQTNSMSKNEYLWLTKRKVNREKIFNDVENIKGESKYAKI